MYKFNVSIENKNQPPTIISIERNFENTYQLGKVFDLDAIKVDMEYGILTIVLPLKEKEKPIRRDIEIN